MPQPIDDDPEFFYGLTYFGGPVFAQLRDTGLAIGFTPEAPSRRSSESGHPVIMTKDEARRLRDLLNVATARGAL